MSHLHCISQISDGQYEEVVQIRIHCSDYRMKCGLYNYVMLESEMTRFYSTNFSSYFPGCEAMESPDVSPRNHEDLIVMENSSLVLICAISDSSGKLKAVGWSLGLSSRNWSEESQSGTMVWKGLRSTLGGCGGWSAADRMRGEETNQKLLFGDASRDCR